MTIPTADPAEPRPAPRALPGGDPSRGAGARSGDARSSCPTPRSTGTSWRSGWPTAVDGEVVDGGRWARRPVRGPPRSDPARPGQPRRAARAAAAGRPARLPRHGDDRARDGHRDRRLPDRARLVGGRPVPPGPAAPPRPRRRAGAADRARRAHPARRLARDLQRPRASTGRCSSPATGWLVVRRRSTAATSTCCRSSAGCSATGSTTRGCGPPRPGCSGCSRHGDVDGWEIPGRYLDFLRGGPAEPLVEVVRHNDQDVRSLARLLVLLASGYGSRRGAADRARRGPRRPRAGVRPGRAASARPSSATTSRWRSRPRRRRRAPVVRCGHGARPRPPDRRRGPVVVAARPGRLRRASPRPAPGAAPSSPVGRVRHTVDDRPDRRRARPPAAPARDAGTTRPTPGRASPRAPGGPPSWPRSSSPSSGSTGCATRSGPCARTGDGLALAERRQRLGRPEPRLEADLRDRARRLRRRLVARAGRQAGRPTNGTRGSGVSSAQRERTWSSVGIERAGHRPAVAGQRIEVVRVVGVGRHERVVAVGHHDDLAVADGPRPRRAAARAGCPTAGRRAGSPRLPGVGSR